MLEILSAIFMNLAETLAHQDFTADFFSTLTSERSR
jgi:hypothetical protein